MYRHEPGAGDRDTLPYPQRSILRVDAIILRFFKQSKGFPSLEKGFLWAGEGTKTQM